MSLKTQERFAASVLAVSTIAWLAALFCACNEPAPRESESRLVWVSNASVSAVPPNDCFIVVCGGTVFYRTGVSPVAVPSDAMLFPGLAERICLPRGHAIAFVRREGLTPCKLVDSDADVLDVERRGP